MIASSHQLVEQRVGLFQVPGLKAFGEPLVYRLQQIECFRALALASKSSVFELACVETLVTVLNPVAHILGVPFASIVFGSRHQASF